MNQISVDEINGSLQYGLSSFNKTEIRATRAVLYEEQFLVAFIYFKKKERR